MAYGNDNAVLVMVWQGVEYATVLLRGGSLSQRG